MVKKDNRAKEKDLASLHGAFAKFLSARLTSGEVSAGELNCIRQFLKDNGIDCAGSANPDVQDLVANLPTFEDVSKDEVSLLN
jgi:hypothetical protein|nr:MAG TPA: DNA packaging protein [Caudoviricetes sp.]